MPYVLLHVKPDRSAEEAGEFLKGALPLILAEELSVKDSELHEGGLTHKEIMVMHFETADTVNGKDIEILVFAHPFAKRIQDIEERKDSIIKRILHLLEERHESLTLAVCVILAPMAYGEAEAVNPIP